MKKNPKTKQTIENVTIVKDENTDRGLEFNLEKKNRKTEGVGVVTQRILSPNCFFFLKKTDSLILISLYHPSPENFNTVSVCERIVVEDEEKHFEVEVCRFRRLLRKTFIGGNYMIKRPQEE